MNNNVIRNLNEVEPLFNSMVEAAKSFKNSWLVLPEEVKDEVGNLF